MKNDRAAVKLTMLELESIHIDPLSYDIKPRGDSQRLDLENAVLMQELMAMKVFYLYPADLTALLTVLMCCKNVINHTHGGLCYDHCVVKDIFIEQIIRAENPVGRVTEGSALTVTSYVYLELDEDFTWGSKLGMLSFTNQML